MLTTELDVDVDPDGEIVDDNEDDEEGEDLLGDNMYQDYEAVCIT